MSSFKAVSLSWFMPIGMGGQKASDRSTPTAKSSTRTNVDSMDVSRPGSARTATEVGKEKGNGRTKRRRVGPVLLEKTDEEQKLDGCEIVVAPTPKVRQKLETTGCPEGRPVLLRCQADGGQGTGSPGETEIQWQREQDSGPVLDVPDQGMWMVDGLHLVGNESKG